VAFVLACVYATGQLTGTHQPTAPAISSTTFHLWRAPGTVARESNGLGTGRTGPRVTQGGTAVGAVAGATTHIPTGVREHPWVNWRITL